MSDDIYYNNVSHVGLLQFGKKYQVAPAAQAQVSPDVQEYVGNLHLNENSLDQSFAGS